MQTRTQNIFTTIRTQGAILPHDLLQRIADPRSGLEGLRPTDYGLAPGERLSEAASRSWSRLTGLWTRYRAEIEKLSANDTGTVTTRERWLLPLFQELGYGRLPRTAAVTIEGKPYPVSHAAAGVPAHLMGCALELDKVERGEPGAARCSPHSLVQELLNRSEDRLWGFVSNGLSLRILRDNTSLTRQAYVEFDLEAMMDGEVYSDFLLLWLVCHASRVQAERPEECWLEKWSRQAHEQGARALDHLRDGVQAAIEALGRGFLAHASNKALRQSLRDGSLPGQEYYRQVLRIVYRLLFVFVAEDRGLLLAPDAPVEARECYAAYYSTARLRALARRRRGSRHSDLYHPLRVTLEKLGSPEGCPALGLPSLGGFLFSPEATAALNGCDIANPALLQAVRELAYTRDDRVLRPVDYLNLGSEELGSVYESLLELHPLIDLDAAVFSLSTAAGSERKTTGSYYTPESLVQCLLESALDPVIEDRLRQARELGGKGSKGVRESASKGLGEKTDGIVPGSDGVAEGDEARGGLLQTDGKLSEVRDVRDDLPDSPGGRLGAGEHSGGLGTADHRGIPPVPAGGTGQPQGTGDSADSQRPGRPSEAGAGGGVSAAGGGHLKAADLPDWFLAAQEEWLSAHPSAPDSLTPSLPYSLLAEKALLSLSICDPACGSGHFLIAAAHRIAKRLATVRAGVDEPSPEETHRALRDVIGRCLYGVDLNPDAVELCKVALWMEALEPGKPLTFLDHHIRCGNSLLGATPELMDGGIPGEAFNPVTGDSKEVAKLVKARNRAEMKSEGQTSLEVSGQTLTIGRLAYAYHDIEEMGDETAADIERKGRSYDAYLKSSEYALARFAADTWCAAFFWPLNDRDAAFPTNAVFRKVEASPQAYITAPLGEHVRLIARENRFFHWQLEFPTIFGQGVRESGSRGQGVRELGSTGVSEGSDPALTPSLAHSLTPSGTPSLPYSLTPAPGGFDVLLGNPPWERIKLQEQEFFASRDPEVATAPNAAARRKLIAALQQANPPLFEAFERAKHDAEAQSKLVRNGGLFPLTGTGDVNTYALFAERFRQHVSPSGRAGLICPTGIATDDTTKAFFGDLTESSRLVAFYGLDNEKMIFAGIDHRNKFGVLIIAGEGAGVPIPIFTFGCSRVEWVKEPQRQVVLTAEDLALLNPNTRTSPIFRTRQDAALTKSIYERVPILIREGGQGVRESGSQGVSEDRNPPLTGSLPHSLTPSPNPWSIRFQAMFHMSNDSGLFRTREQLEAGGWTLNGNVFEKGASRCLPLYEAKMIWQFDHRYGTYEGATRANLAEGSLPQPGEEWKANPANTALPRYWVPEDEVEERLVKRDREGNITWQWDRGWLLGFRDVTSAVVERTAIFSLMSRVGVGHTGPLVFPSVHSSGGAACLVASLTAMVFDYFARQKVAGVHLTYGYLNQLPVLPPTAYSPPATRFIVPRVLELTYTAHDMRPFAEDVWQEADGDLRAEIEEQWRQNDQGVRESGSQGVSDSQGVSESESQGVSEDRNPALTPLLAHSLTPLGTPSDTPSGTGSLPHSLTPLGTPSDTPSGTPSLPHSLTPFSWLDDRRALIRAELDAFYAALYGLNRKQLRYILDPHGLSEKELEDILDPWEDPTCAGEHLLPETCALDFPGETFRVLKDKEEKQFGEYRTRRLVLEAWDRLSREGLLPDGYDQRKDRQGVRESGSRGQGVRESGSRGQGVRESGSKGVSEDTDPALTPSLAPSGTPSLPHSLTPSGAPSGTPSGAPSGTPSLPHSLTPSVGSPVLISGRFRGVIQSITSEAQGALDLDGAPPKLRYQVVIDGTGEVKHFISPPARVEVVE